MKVKMNVANTSDLLGKLQHLASAGPVAVDTAVRTIARATAERAVERMPSGGVSAPGQAPHRQTQDLANSVKALTRKTARGVRGRTGTDRVEGYFLEFGTSSMEPRPWLMPAFEAVSQEAEDMLRDAFEVSAK